MNEPKKMTREKLKAAGLTDAQVDLCLKLLSDEEQILASCKLICADLRAAGVKLLEIWGTWLNELDLEAEEKKWVEIMTLRDTRVDALKTYQQAVRQAAIAKVKFDDVFGAPKLSTGQDAGDRENISLQ